MSFDSWIVGFGLSRILLELGLVQGLTAYEPLMLAVLVDSYLFYGFFKTRRRNTVSITASSALEFTARFSSQPRRDGSG